MLEQQSEPCYIRIIYNCSVLVLTPGPTFPQGSGHGTSSKTAGVNYLVVSLQRCCQQAGTTIQYTYTPFFLQYLLFSIIVIEIICLTYIRAYLVDLLWNLIHYENDFIREVILCLKMVLHDFLN